MTPPVVKRYLIALDKYKWIGLTSFAMVVGASGVIALQPEPPPSYIGDGALTYSGPAVSFSATGTQIQQQGQELTEDVLLSNQLIETVAAKENLNPRLLSQNVEVRLPKKTKTGELESPIITVKYKDTEPRRAGDTVAALMQEMVQQSRLINTARLREIIKSINQRIPQARQELTNSEQNLERYDRREGPALLAAQNGSLLSAITGSENQRQQIQLTLSGIDAQIRSLQTKLGLSSNEAYVSSALSADPIIANLRSQIYQAESQLAILKKDLRPEHPTMVQLRRQQQGYEQLLQQRAAEVIGGDGTAAPLPNTSQVRTQSSLDPARQQLANSLVNWQTQRETLQQQLIDLAKTEQKLRREYATIPNKQLERSRIEQQVLLKKALYDQIQAKLVDSRAAEAETVSSLSIARPPIVTPVVVPIRSVPLTLGLGVIVGLLVGGGIIFLLGSLESTFKTMEDIRESLRQRDVAVLGVLPLLRVLEVDREGVPVLVEPDSPYLQFYERWRINLRRAEDKNLKVVLITSTVSFEGKTVSAYNLGIASARAGRRTLIVETDLRSPSQCHSLKVALDPNAAVEPLRYYGNTSQCIRLVPEIENLYIVPSPGPVPQAAAILESSEMRRLLEDVRGRFDLVIVDTPALSLSNDALLLEPLTDGMLLVTRPGYTEENLLAEAIDQLTESDLRLLGATINGVDMPISLPDPTEDIASDNEQRSSVEVPAGVRQ